MSDILVLLCVLTAMSLSTELVALRLATPSLDQALDNKLPNFAEQEFDIYHNPGNSECFYLPNDIPDNLSDYARLLKTGSGKKIKFYGDSLMQQVFEVIKCAAHILDMHIDETHGKHGEISYRVKHSRHAAEATALQIDFRGYYIFDGLPIKYSLPLRKRGYARGNKAPNLAENSQAYDHLFANLGHHELWYDERWTWEQVANSIFNETRKNINEHTNFTWIGHPTSHFATGNGGYSDRPGDKNYVKNGLKCSCDLPALEEQPIIQNSRLAEQLAPKYGFNYISIWQDFAKACDMHPANGDCLHYRLSPSLFAAVFKKIENAM